MNGYNFSLLVLYGCIAFFYLARYRPTPYLSSAVINFLFIEFLFLSSLDLFMKIFKQTLEGPYPIYPFGNVLLSSRALE